VLRCVAVCCSVLQCVAVCCVVLQCVTVRCSVLQCVAVCCSVTSQNMTALFGGFMCSLLQCVAVCCNVLQCVAMCCGMLKDDKIYSEHILLHLCPPKVCKDNGYFGDNLHRVSKYIYCTFVGCQSIFNP